MFGWRKPSRRARGADGAASEAPGDGASGKAPGDGAAAVRTRRADALVRRLEWTVIRRLDGLLQGDYHTLFRGFGIDFADLREYQPGDDVRYIDWNVTARLQTPHVREFQEDREIAAWFLLDLSGSVDFGSGDVRKRALLGDFTAVMARLLTRHGNRVGAMLYSGAQGARPAVVPARAGRRHLLHLLDCMHAAPAAARGETRLADLLDHARGVVSRRSAVFVVSDFISAPGWETSLGLLARQHDVVAVRLVDPLESALPDLGLVVLQDAETGEQLLVDTHDASFRKRFVEAAAAREAELRDAFARAGVACLSLGTDERLDLALLKFAQQRRRPGGDAKGADAPVAEVAGVTPARSQEHLRAVLMTNSGASKGPAARRASAVRRQP
ncbi:DUF58 domain-containing protein [Bordetella genomosp. 8]|uniref:DUF58 domain-containing protein n=1 Tax=Bordetella genomosp. 8 TaxID=1416806 RepID=A0A1W6YLV5_9BORD|nr:DUF58 domain-containing protein [Bordetella genomosp. 8]ARP82057.1 DUF58 domain-containing protein [Bordetella genomosp. 8]